MLAHDLDELRIEGERITALASAPAEMQPTCPADAALHIGFALRLLEHEGSPQAQALGASLSSIRCRFMAGRCAHCNAAVLSAMAASLSGCVADARNADQPPPTAALAGTTHWLQRHSPAERTAWMLGCRLFARTPRGVTALGI